MQLLDAASDAAQGASGLPVGMLSPHVTRSPTPLSRLCALGVADAYGELKRLVPEGAGWQATEVDNLGHDPGCKPAAIVRPSALVHAWLNEARDLGRLQTRWSSSVHRLEWRDREWQALNSAGEALAHAPVVVVASAYGALGLLEGLFHADMAALPLRPVQGQLSLAPLLDEPLASRPMRNNGVFVPHYEDRGLPPLWPSRVWAMGSTYDRGSQDVTVRADAHERNAASLEQMHPQAAARLRQCADRGELLGWAQVRCASLDRVPMVGAVPDQPALIELMRQAGHRRGRIPLSGTPRLAGLYMMSALGSRGLTLAHWCADWLAARICGEASPLPESDQDLERAFDPARFAWKSARRQEA